MATTFAALLTVSAVLCSTAFHVGQPGDFVKRSSQNYRHYDTLRMAQTDQKLAAVAADSSNSPIPSRPRRKTPEAPRAKPKSNPTNTAQAKNVCDQIKALGDAREWTTAKKLFLSRKSPSKAEFSAAIYAARGCKEHKDGMKLYELMVKDLGQQSVNLYTYDNIISLNLDYGDDKRALEVFKSLQMAEKLKKDKHESSDTVQPKLTAASEINLQKCFFNALRASLNIQFQDSKSPEIVADSKNTAATAAAGGSNFKGIVKSEDVAFFHSSSPTKNAMEETIQSILDQNWVFLPKDKSLIVRAYASWNMTVQLAEMTDFIFQDPLPDMWTLQTYMNSMLESHPELALLSLQWYLPVKSTEGSLEGTGTDTILSGIISSTTMAEKRKGRDTLSNLNTEIISARCLGLAVKALARLDYFVGESLLNSLLLSLLLLLFSSLLLLLLLLSLLLLLLLSLLSLSLLSSFIFSLNISIAIKKNHFE